MMTHDEFVFAAYAITAVAIAALALFTWLDQRGRLAELAELEAMGVRRRSDERKRNAETPTS